MPQLKDKVLSEYCDDLVEELVNMDDDFTEEQARVAVEKWSVEYRKNIVECSDDAEEDAIFIADTEKYWA